MVPSTTTRTSVSGPAASSAPAKRVARTSPASTMATAARTSLPWDADAEDLHHLLDVLPHQPLVGRIAQQVRRVERRHELDAVIVVPAPAQPRDGLLRAEERLHRELAERHDDLRLDQLELADEERLAAGHLV